MRVLSKAVSGWFDPADVFASLFRTESHAVWLDCGIHAREGISIIGVAARRVTSSVADRCIVVDGVAEEGTIFDFLRSELTGHAIPAGEGFQLGWIGWLGYEVRAQTMGTALSRHSRYPDSAMIFLDRAITFDHSAGVVSLLALGDDWTGELNDWRKATIARMQGSQDAELSVGVPTGASTHSPLVHWAYSDDEYLKMIRECQSAIREGDAYQLCLTTEVAVDVHPDPLQVYLELRRSSPTHHGAFFRMGGLSLLSASPEQFISVTPTGVVESKPIKGTRRRGQSPEEDARLIEELVSSDKERAENLMIVDLMRNDIGRVAEVGTVSVPSLLAVESYAQVHQLVSTVRGTLAAGVSGVDAAMACFPAGSMTGAPKRSATSILDRVEARPRGIYAGAFGYFGLDGRIDLAMVIRSIVLDREGATIGTGGGITALSVPEEELDEVYLKAAALLRVLGVDGVR